MKKQILNILSATFIFSLGTISSSANYNKADTTPPEITYTEERIGDRERIRVTIATNDESGIQEFKDHQGNTIIGDTITVDFSRRVDSTFTAIDNAGNKGSITIDLSWINPLDGLPLDGIENSSRRAYLWNSSNLREWLNSVDVEFTMDRDASYDELGFLSEFTDKDINAIAVTERRVMIPWFYEKSLIGGSYQVPTSHPVSLGAMSGYGYGYVYDYENYRYTKSNDKVFILNQSELMWYVNRRGNSFKKQLTEEAQIKNNINSKNYDWLVQSGALWSRYEDIIVGSGSDWELSYKGATVNNLGIVPALNIKPDYVFDDNRKAQSLNVDDIVYFGRYLGSPIKWRVVHISEGGFPLLVSEDILDIKNINPKGKYPRLYSDFVNFSNPDISMMHIDYKSKSGSLDISPPAIEVIDEEPLNKRQNNPYSLRFRVIDDSEIDYIKLPNGIVTTDTQFEYTFEKNGSYIFETKDIHGNFNRFGIPVYNINENPILNISSSSGEEWSNDVKIDIRSSNDVKVSKNGLVFGSGNTHGGVQFPNYASYNNSKFRVKTKIKLIETKDNSINEKMQFAFRYSTNDKNKHSYKLKAVDSIFRTVSVADLLIADNNTLEFIDEYTIPSNYSSGLRPYIHQSVHNPTDKHYKVEIDYDYEIIDDSDFAISSIILPDGTEVKDVKNYTDIIALDGIHDLTYTVVDNRGVLTQKTITVKVDKTKPILDLQYDYDKFEFLENKSLQVSLSGSDALSGFKRIKLPNGNYITSQNATYTITDYGTHVFECEDTAGNITKKIVEVEDMSAFEDAESAVENAELTNLSEDISNARDLVNRLPESSKKDELQDRLNAISPNISLALKSATSNLDIYIKSENMLSLSLDTNYVSFDNFSGAEDVERQNAINLTVSSSLPYKVNASLQSEIQNSDKSKTMDKSILNIKADSDTTYKTFGDILSPITILDDQSNGNNITHGIDLKLKGNIAHEKDVYKTTIKIEVEQK